MPNHSKQLRVVDSHTGGEPTRLIVSGAPNPPAGSMAERLGWFKNNCDHLRRALANEPRGSDVVVGGAIFEPTEAGSKVGVLYFNNVGYLGMCVHGTIGLMVTLAYLGQIQPGEHRVETPVGPVTATLHNDSEVTVENVPSYRSAASVPVGVPHYGKIRGDVAWAGNWFFLVSEHPMEIAVSNVDKLTEFTWAIRLALRDQGITGSDGGEIDHVELYGPSKIPGVNSKNFVLCPGRAYDRSPCGTGTSAKLACLYADGKLKPGQPWRQESIVGSVFEGTIAANNGRVVPRIRGSAFITADSQIVVDPNDPFRFGIPT